MDMLRLIMHFLCLAVSERSDVKFAFVYHAGHPVSRHDSTVISADYIAAIREGIRDIYGQIPIIFLQGCGGDIRPNITKKRRKYLPKL